MKVFKIKITEALSKIVEIEAASRDEAISKVKGLYQNAVLTLDESDYTEIFVAEVEDSVVLENVLNKNVKSLN